MFGRGGRPPRLFKDEFPLLDGIPKSPGSIGSPARRSRYKMSPARGMVTAADLIAVPGQPTLIASGITARDTRRPTFVKGTLISDPQCCRCIIALRINEILCQKKCPQ